MKINDNLSTKQMSKIILRNWIIDMIKLILELFSAIFVVLCWVAFITYMKFENNKNQCELEAIGMLVVTYFIAKFLKNFYNKYLD